nr:hypothetical protein [Tanacetum cinerariifolium]
MSPIISSSPVTCSDNRICGVVSQCSLLYVRSFNIVKDVVVKFKDLQSDLEVASLAVTLVDGTSTFNPKLWKPCEVFIAMMCYC